MHSIFDGTYLTAPQKTAIQNGTQTGDLTTTIHNALNHLNAGTFPDGTGVSGPGAALYFPAGLYPCNLVLGATGGIRDNVHLVGEARGGTRLQSFAAGGFAVQDAYIEDASEAPLHTRRRSISNISFMGAGLTRSGLLIASKVGTETSDLLFFDCQIGMMVCDTYYGTHLRPVFRGCDIGAWFGSISGTLTGFKAADRTTAAPNVVLPAFLAATNPNHDGHAGNQSIIGSEFLINRIGLLAFGSHDTPNLKLFGGSFEGNHISLFIPSRATATQLAQQHRAHFASIYLDSMWFELNGEFYAGAGNETVNGWVGRRSNLHVGQGVVRLNNVWVEEIKVEGPGQIYGDNMVYNRSGNPAFYDIPEPSRVIYDRADGNGGDFYGPIVKRPIPSESPSCTGAMVPHKRSFGHYRNVVIADSCTGSRFVVGLSSWNGDEFVTHGVRDGLLASTCVEMTLPSTGFRALKFLPVGGVVISKAYVLMAMIKPIGIAMAWGWSATSLTAGKLLPPDIWSTFALVGVALNNETELLFGFSNSTGSTHFARIGGLALLQFDNKDEAAEACAGDIFPLKTLPPRSRVLG